MIAPVNGIVITQRKQLIAGYIPVLLGFGVVRHFITDLVVEILEYTCVDFLRRVILSFKTSKINLDRRYMAFVSVP